MNKLKILSIGKTKESWLEDALQEYIKRLQNLVTIEFIWAKSDEQLLALCAKEPLLICFDAGGTTMSSEQFSDYIIKKFEEGGSRLAIVIGGAEGLPPALKGHPSTLSLSRMTFTHQLVRLILLEQLYRAFEIHKGSRYHK